MMDRYYCYNVETFTEKSSLFNTLIYPKKHATTNYLSQVMVLFCREPRSTSGYESNKVAIYITGFMPYFYVEAENEEVLHAALGRCRCPYKEEIPIGYKMEKVFKKGYVGFQMIRPFYKVSFYTDYDRKRVARILLAKKKLLLYNTTPDPILQFKNETDLSACCFVEVDQKLSFRSKYTGKKSLDVDYEIFTEHVALSPATQIEDVPFLSICSFDIETNYTPRNEKLPSSSSLWKRRNSIEVEGEDDLPPHLARNRCVAKKRKLVPRAAEAEENSFPIIQVGLLSRWFSPTTNEYIEKENIILSVGETGNIDDREGMSGVANLSFKSEADLLRGLCRLMKRANYDIIVGHNIANFDLYEIVQRMTKHGISPTIFGWSKVTSPGPYLMSLAKYNAEMKCGFPFGRNKGEKDLTAFGCVFLDTYRYIKTNYMSESSFKLNELARKYCGGITKDDVAYSEISTLQLTRAGRHRLAVYCLRDCELVVKLLETLRITQQVIAMAKFTHVDMRKIIWEGQEKRIFSLFHKFSSLANVVLETPEQTRCKETESIQLVGGLVLEPVAGCERTPLPVLDFSSLYPSIIWSLNVCASTEISAAMIKDKAFVEGEDYMIIDTNIGPLYYLTTKHAVSILAQMEEVGMGRRNEIKKTIADAVRNMLPEHVVDRLRVEEMQVKQVNNSIYGFLGRRNSTIMPMQTIRVALSITAQGRNVLRETARIATCEGFDVIYGDTDSIFLRVRDVNTIDDLYKLWYSTVHTPDKEDRRSMVMSHMIEDSKRLADKVNRTLPGIMKLEFEKLLFVTMLFTKKKYIAGHYSTAYKKDYDLIKGVEAKRRDQCVFSIETMKTIYSHVIKDEMVDAAMVACRMCKRLEEGGLGVDDFVLSKSWTKTEYVNQPAHVSLALAQEARGDPNRPAYGDRVEFVNTIHFSGLGSTIFVEDPAHIKANNLVIDKQRAFEVYLKRPVERIMAYIFNDKAILSFFLFDYPKIMTQRKYEAALSDGKWPFVPGQVQENKHDNAQCDDDDQETMTNWLRCPFSAQLKRGNLWLKCVSRFLKQWDDCTKMGGHLLVQYKIMKNIPLN